MAYRRVTRRRSYSGRGQQSFAGNRGRSVRRSAGRRTLRSAGQTLRLVIETSPASSVSREVAGVAAKLNPPPRKSKF